MNLNREAAGILFYYDGADGREFLLAKRTARTGRGRWGPSGGFRERYDRTLWDTAVRETREEFGDHAEVARALATFSGQGELPHNWLFVIPGLLRFRTYAIELEEKPGLQRWPSRHAVHGFEWSEAAWFSTKQLPGKLGPGLWRPYQIWSGLF